MSKFASCLDCLSKTAEDSGKRYLQALKHVGVGALGFGLGTAAGKGTGLLLGKLDRGGVVPGANVARWVGPAAGAGLGLAYSLWKQKEKEEIQRALQGNNSSSEQGLSGK
jgi:hypothetical protein